MKAQQMNSDSFNPWIISDSRMARFTFDHPGFEKSPTTAREYWISAIGRYLISPTALNVRKRLVGCEIKRHDSPLLSWKKRLLRLTGKKGAGRRPHKTLVMDFPKLADQPTDPTLRLHLDRLYDGFRPFDSFHRAMDSIDIGQVAQVTGICVDDAGYRSPVAIDGEPDQQVDYIRRNVNREIEVRLKQAYVANGLFEMKGFDFINFNPDLKYRLIRLVQEGTPRACILNEDHTIAFWLEDVKLVNYLQLLEYCIQRNHQMREALFHCTQGKAAALRLMFNHRLEIDYSRAPLPAVFQEVIGNNHPVGYSDRLIKQNLNHHQVGVSLNIMTLLENGSNELRTHISILQNLQALEPIKNSLPTLFEEIARRSAQSEEGQYYLLESICGDRNES